MNINNVANYFVQLGHDKPDLAVTPKKIQKLLYYAQAWHLVVYEEPLFKDVVFQAWQHGTVCYEIYDRYRGFGYNPIIPLFEEVNLDASKEKFINLIWKIYGHFTGDQLEEMTHKEEPWIIARGDLAPEEKCKEPLEHSIIKESYSQALREYSLLQKANPRNNVVEFRNDEITPDLDGLYQLNKKSTANSLLQFSNTWKGNDLEDCLRVVYENRGEVEF